MTKTRIDKAKVAAQFIGAIPFSRALGMTLEEIGAGWARISMPWSDDLVGDPKTGVIHGGAISALMDTCGGAAVMSHPDGAVSTATIDLRIDYMRAARPGHRVTAEAECHHVTRSVAFVRATARDEEGGTPVATATGAFTFERQTPADAAPGHDARARDATEGEAIGGKATADQATGSDATEGDLRKGGAP